jgi:hypothetical protein
MTEYSFLVPGAERLASLAGLKSDFESVVGYCERMIERYAGTHQAAQRTMTADRKGSSVARKPKNFRGAAQRGRPSTSTFASK